VAVDWQSEEISGGFEQLVMQNVRRSSQLGSGGALFPVPESEELGESDGPDVSVHAPRWTLVFWSVHVMKVPPTHAVWPHASARRSPFCSTAQLQMSFDEEEHAKGTTQGVANTRKAARAARGPVVI
jgi:hypothetical protein